MCTKDKLNLNNKGYAMAFICAALPVFLAMAGLVIDCGSIMLYKARLMTAVKFAAISATSNYYEDDDEVVIRDNQEFVEKALYKNFPDAELTAFIIDPNESGDRNVCEVEASAHAPLFFMPLLKEIYEESESIETGITVSESYIAKRSIADD